MGMRNFFKKTGESPSRRPTGQGHWGSVEVEFPANASGTESLEIAPDAAIGALVEEYSHEQLSQDAGRAAEAHASDAAKTIAWFSGLSGDAREVMVAGGAIEVSKNGGLPAFEVLLEKFQRHAVEFKWLLGEASRLSDMAEREQALIDELVQERDRLEQEALELYRHVRDGQLQQVLAERYPDPDLSGRMDPREIRLGTRATLQQQYRLGMDTKEGGPAVELAIFDSRDRLDEIAKEQGINGRHLAWQISQLVEDIDQKTALLEQLKTEKARVRAVIAAKAQSAGHSLEALDVLVPGQKAVLPPRPQPGNILAKVGLRGSGVTQRGEIIS